MAYFKRLKGNKYGALKINGYDSKAEARRGAELELLQAAGKISNLRKQVKIVLIPAQYEASGEFYKSGAHKGEPKPGKLIERECSYIADFVYTKDGEQIVEDVKGYKGGEAYRLFAIKRKLLLFLFGIRVTEIGGNE